MKTYRCSFSFTSWVVIVALSADSAATIYANERYITSKEKSMKVNVYNESDSIDEGWYLIEYQEVTISDAKQSTPPSWAGTNE